MEAATDIKAREYNESLLQRRYEEFVRRWAPENKRWEFDSELMMLVRAIHSDAARPYEQSMQKMMEALPILAFAPQAKP